MSPAERYLRNIGAPVCTVPDVALALDITPSTLYQRLKNYPELSKPETFKAGGKQMMMVDYAIGWAEKHVAEMVAKGRG